MNDKVVSEVIKRLDSIGAQMKVTGIKLGEEAIKYTQALAIGNLIVELVIIMVFVWSLINLIKEIPKQKFGYNGNITSLYWFFSTTTIMTGLFSILALCTLPDTIATLISPTWGVIKSFISSKLM